MTNSIDWYRRNPGKAAEQNRRYLAKPGVAEKRKQYRHEWYLKNKDKCNARSKETTLKMTVEQQLLKSSKYNAKKFGREHTICLDDIIVPEVCPILGITLERGNGRMHGASPTLDRVDNSKGYVPGNVRVISLKANSHKSNMTVDEIKRLYDYVLGLVE